MNQICELKTSGLFGGPCKQTAVARCIYCGRPFCGQHGVIKAEQEEICSRKECVAKMEDLVVHLVYKAAVLERNVAGRCGVDGCGAPRWGECSRCRLFYCERHVEQRLEKVVEEKMSLQRVASLCEHCFKRRVIWLKN